MAPFSTLVQDWFEKRMFPTDDSPPGLCVNRWRVVYLGVVLVCAGGAIAGCATLLSLPSVAADPSCAGTNVAFVAFTLAAGAVLCILSMLDACGNRGLLPAAFIWAYMVFLAWSAIYANPDSRVSCRVVHATQCIMKPIPCSVPVQPHPSI